MLDWCGGKHLSLPILRDFLLTPRRRDSMTLRHVATLVQIPCGMKKQIGCYVLFSLVIFNTDLTPLNPNSVGPWPSSNWLPVCQAIRLYSGATETEQPKRVEFPLLDCGFSDFIFSDKFCHFYFISWKSGSVHEKLLNNMLNVKWKAVKQHAKCEMSTLPLTFPFRASNEDLMGFYSGFLILVVHWRREFESCCTLLMIICPCPAWNTLIVYGK